MTAFYLLLIILAVLSLIAFFIWLRYYLEDKIWQSRGAMPFVQHLPKEIPAPPKEKKLEEAPKSFEPVERTENKLIEVAPEEVAVKVSTHKAREAKRKKLRNSIFIAEMLKRKQ